jgi:phosphomannomutase
MEWRCVVGCTGAGGPIMMELLKELGCEVVGINLEQTGRFAHPPEPIPEHLVRPTADWFSAVSAQRADRSDVCTYYIFRETSARR